MRIVGEVPHPIFKITIFSWNNRYLIKFEHGYYEQTYKIDQFELAHENNLHKIVSDDFINEVSLHFNAMAQSLNKAMQSF